MLPKKLQNKIQERKASNSFRKLQDKTNLIDFSSNDYLGFAQTGNGATGSRLITGNFPEIEFLEKKIAHFHQLESGLIFNSGYTANLGLLSSVPQRNDTIIIDELSHASILDGCRLSYANTLKFKHNSLEDLEKKITKASGEVYVVTEAVFSMDGDFGRIETINELCKKYNAHFIVDEAHSVGVFGDKGRGLCFDKNIIQNLFALIVTFGKAIGSHGAIVLGNKDLKDYLVNFSRPFIYTTAPSPNHIKELETLYNQLEKDGNKARIIHSKIKLFKENIDIPIREHFIKSESQIQSLVVGEVFKTKMLSDLIKKDGFDVKPILSPTVKFGKERIRICIHAFNSDEQIINLGKSINTNWEKVFS